VLTNLLPGLREIRAPLISGYLWLVFFFLAFHEDLPTRHDADSTLMPLFDLGHDLSALGIATVSGVAAYLLGSAVQELLKLLAQLPPGQPLYAEAGTHLSSSGRLDVDRAVRLQTQAIQRKLFQVALSPGERGVDEEPSTENVEQELPLIRTLLLGEHSDLVGELDRLQAEADLRITVAVPIVAFAGLLCFAVSVGWLFALVPAALLLAQGFQRQIEVGDLLAKALRIGKVNAPSLESLDASAVAAIERIELEEDLAKKVRDEQSPMAAFRLGNLQASGEDYEGAVRSLRFAAENEVFRAYAEVGFVYEALGQDGDAEQAYRDGEKRRDRRSTKRLAGLLRRLQRDEEALATESRPSAKEREPGKAMAADEISITEYEKRIDEGEVKAAINLGLLRQRRDEWAASIDAYERATKLDDEDAQAWLALGNAFRHLGRAGEAEVAFVRARALLELSFGGEHLEVAEALSGLGAAKNELGQFGEAQELFERALKIQEKEVGGDTVEAAFSLSGLAVAHNGRGELDRGVDLMGRALRIEEQELGPEAPSVATSLQSLAAMVVQAGDYVKAKALLDRAVEIQEASPSVSDGDLAYALDTLGVYWDTVGRYQEGLELHERAIDLQERELPPEHLEVMMSQVCRADSLHGLGRYAQARDILQWVIPVFEQTYSPDHVFLVDPLVVYSKSLVALGDAEAGESLAERAFQNTLSTGSGPGLRGKALVSGGRALNGLGSYDEAVSCFERALEAQESAFGRDHLYLAITLAELGRSYLGMHRHSQAQQLYLRALGILTEAPVTHDPAFGIVRRGLAEALWKAMDVDRAEVEIRMSIASFEEAFGSVHPEIAKALDLLAEMLAERGDSEQAAAARGRAASIRDKPEDEQGAKQ